MKILVYAPVFYPMVGGMETDAQCTADLLTKAGHECIMVTPVGNSETDTYPFKVYRAPGVYKKIKLIQWADLIYSNGASLALLPYAKLLGKFFVWKHAGYQASCIDGLGWVDGNPAPTDPWNSMAFHYKTTGLVYAITGFLKLSIRRFVANYLVDMNIAITNWMNDKQPFKKQIVIYNPAPLYNFLKPSKEIIPEFDFVYLGRLVSEKGVSTLLKAFQLLLHKRPNVPMKLLIIGDGELRGSLEGLTGELNIASSVTFAGKKTGQELTDLIHSTRIAVVPSEWEEPMGIVALELMAAGRNIIVSERGGLKECVGEGGLLFQNGNAEELAECMMRFLTDQELCDRKKQIALVQLKKFEPEVLIQQYIHVFHKILNRK